MQSIEQIPYDEISILLLRAEFGSNRGREELLRREVARRDALALERLFHRCKDSLPHEEACALISAMVLLSNESVAL